MSFLKFKSLVLFIKILVGAIYCRLCFRYLVFAWTFFKKKKNLEETETKSYNKAARDYLRVHLVQCLENIGPVNNRVI